MRNQNWKNVGLFAVVSLLGLTVGCQDATEPMAKAKDDVTEQASVDTHSEWWCSEHGIPEQECTMCSTVAAKEFKAKGDWCKEHNRAKSQCFLCNPEFKEKYAAKYRTKYGKEPPAIDLTN